MEKIELVEVQKKYAVDIWEFRQEILECDAENEDRFAGCMSLDKSKSVEEWIRICELRKSEKTILANGGIYEKTIDVDDCKMKRYWITV